MTTIISNHVKLTLKTKLKRIHNDTDYSDVLITPFNLVLVSLLFLAATGLITLWGVISFSFLYGIYASTTILESVLHVINFTVAFFGLGNVIHMQVTSFINFE